MSVVARVKLVERWEKSECGYRKDPSCDANVLYLDISMLVSSLRYSAIAWKMLTLRETTFSAYGPFKKCFILRHWKFFIRIFCCKSFIKSPLI